MDPNDNALLRTVQHWGHHEPSITLRLRPPSEPYEVADNNEDSAHIPGRVALDEQEEGRRRGRPY